MLRGWQQDVELVLSGGAMLRGQCAQKEMRWLTLHTVAVHVLLRRTIVPDSHFYSRD